MSKNGKLYSLKSMNVYGLSLQTTKLGHKYDMAKNTAVVLGNQDN